MKRRAHLRIDEEVLDEARALVASGAYPSMRALISEALEEELTRPVPRWERADREDDDRQA